MSHPLRPRASRSLLLLLLVAVTLAGFYGLITLASGWKPAFSPLAVAGGALLLALLAYVVVRAVSRRSGRSGDATVGVEAPTPVVEQPVDAARQEDTDPDVEGDAGLEPVALDAQALPDRVTQLHIKTLETALEEQSARIAELERESTGGHDLERVLLTVGALRQRVHGNPESESLLNRVEAAVLRLNASSVPARPALAAPVPGSRVALAPATTATIAAAPAVVAEQAPVAEQPVAEQPVAPPAIQQPDEPVPDEHAAPVPPSSRSAAPIDAPVLPVPPPPVQVAARTSRWRRRGAA